LNEAHDTTQILVSSVNFSCILDSVLVFHDALVKGDHAW